MGGVLTTIAPALHFDNRDTLVAGTQEGADCVSSATTVVLESRFFVVDINRISRKPRPPSPVLVGVSGQGTARDMRSRLNYLVYFLQVSKTSVYTCRSNDLFLAALACRSTLCSSVSGCFEFLCFMLLPLSGDVVQILDPKIEELLGEIMRDQKLSFDEVITMTETLEVLLSRPTECLDRCSEMGTSRTTYK